MGGITGSSFGSNANTQVHVNDTTKSPTGGGTQNIRVRTGGTSNVSVRKVQQPTVEGSSTSHVLDGGQHADDEQSYNDFIAGENARMQAQADKVRRESNAKQGIKEDEGDTALASVLAAAGLKTGKPKTASDQRAEAVKKQVKKDSGLAPSVSVADVQQVAGAEDQLEEQPKTASESTGFVDTKTGELVEHTPERGAVEAKPEKKPRKHRKLKITEKERRAASKWDREAKDGIRTTVIGDYGFDDKDLDDPNLVQNRAIAHNKALLRSKEQQALRDEAADRRSLGRSLKNWVPAPPLEEIWASAKKDFYTQQRQKELDEQQARYDDAEADAKQQDANPVVIPGRRRGDEEWRLFQNLDGAKTEEERLAKLTQYQLQRSNWNVEEEAEADEEYEAQDKERRHYEWEKPEDQILETFRKAQRETVKRLLNPILLRIESQYVETKIVRENGKNIVEGRIRYKNQNVERAISNIRDLYNCSHRSVMELVQLRAGLGVDLKGQIGKKQSDKFVLSDNQFIELCHDIERSQELYGHPMGLVQGTPYGGGVRDDSGKFVVVAGTRCFPMGYMPVALLRELTTMEGSKMQGMDIGTVQSMIRATWLNKTYPDLLSNQEGNLMWQARAIENMMRAVMSLDGIDPARANIPEIVINKTMMQMAVEKERQKDPGILRALDERERREREALSRFKNSYVKNNGARDRDGSLLSVARRAGGFIDNGFRALSSLQIGSKVADFFLFISNPLEAMNAMQQQNVGSFITEKVMAKKLGKDIENYKLTDRLSEVASMRETVEALSVAESLYRIGGWTAIEAYQADMGEDGRHKYKFNNADLRDFLDYYGVPSGKVSEQFLQKLGISPEQSKGFAANARGILEGFATGSQWFKDKEAQQFVRNAMLEMARFSGKGESYTSDEVLQWADQGGGDEMIRSLLMTQAGQEAFMTQGITSLGRKSPWTFAIRKVLAKNGVTEFAVRSLFDRFPEYGLNKLMSIIPFSNTLSYLGSYMVNGVGSMVNLMLSEENGLNRAGDYQAGRRLSPMNGFLKNLMYDTIMAGNKILIAGIYFGVLQLLGGLFPPKKPEDEYNWSEWIIGEGEDALPIKWAWFMDDLSGIGLPLGAAMSIAYQGGLTPEAIDRAAKTFLNAVANFNMGTQIFEAIDLVNNFEDEMKDAIGRGETGAWLNPSLDERKQTSFELMCWGFLGDMTPTIVKQLLPWSRDFLFRPNPDARSASKVYDTDKYTMEEAKKDYHVKSVDSYKEYMLRREAQNNPLAALFMDLASMFEGSGSERTGYMFTEQPIRTETDKLAKANWDRFYLDENSLPRNPDEAREICRSHAAAICDYISANFQDPTDALSKGFILNPTARIACQEYCRWMTEYKGGIDQMCDKRLAELREEMCMNRLPDDIYQSTIQTYQDMKQRYKNLNNDYFSSKKIPWSLPKYVLYDSDMETRYVDENGNAAVNPFMAGLVNNVTDLLGIDYSMTPGTAERYSYGNLPTVMPVFSPQPTKGFNNEVEPYWVQRDKDGNLLTNPQDVYESLGGLPEGVAGPIPESASSIFGFDGVTDDDLTLGRRGAEQLDSTIPEGVSEYYDPEQASKLLGFDAAGSEKETAEREKSAENELTPTSSYGSRSYGSGGYYRSYGGGGYYYGGSGGSYSSSYNPKIYSTSKQVYSKGAAGMSVRQPYKANTTYLRPEFRTSGSRKPYSRLG